MNKMAQSSSLSLCFILLLLFIAGCGGGGGVSVPTPTPSPTSSTDPGPTPTPSSTTAGDAIYVSPSGMDGNPGTLGSPTTLQSAITRVAAGGTIYLLSGTYNFSATITIERTNSGSAGATKNIYAYSSSLPVLNFSAQAFASTNRGLQVYGHYWHIRGLIVEYAGDNGIYIGGNYNTIENCETRFNRDSGLQLGRYSSSLTSINDWPAYNLILNCYSHDNYDPDNGEDADGFGCKLTTGYGNVFRGCIAAYNADDGWDLYTKTETGAIGPVTIEYCIAHDNGKPTTQPPAPSGDKNGFKLGGDDIAVNHILRYSVAFGNTNHGFTCNNNTGNIDVSNCTAYNNAANSGKYNFNFNKGAHTFTNNLSYKPTMLSNNDHVTTNLSNIDIGGRNVWWRNNASASASGLICTDADFTSLSISLPFPRNLDGSPNFGSFLGLASGSDLLNSGTGGLNIGAR